MKEKTFQTLEAVKPVTKKFVNKQTIRIDLNFERQKSEAWTDAQIQCCYESTIVTMTEINSRQL